MTLSIAGTWRASQAPPSLIDSPPVLAVGKRLAFRVTVSEGRQANDRKSQCNMPRNLLASALGSTRIGPGNGSSDAFFLSAGEPASGILAS